ncbi:hypothetical protein DUI87_23102 [Hirundo rustica rustica]|uniref:Mab-21-like HhH/H2TH-like domain-containing protein n=1 Tax=Hirundo rustica rustica TaxID=333673 RepID=A0A3M0JJI4_HIRRU|nr:hypothetical protein DUI87_23102 [Hirundo rustica rustica]
MVLLLLVQGLIQYPQQAGDGLDEATRERMQQRAEYLNRQMSQLLQELEQKNPEQSAGAWGALLMWQFWALTGILTLLLALWFGLRKIRRDPDNSGYKDRSSINLVEEEDEEEGHDIIAKKEIESNNTNVEEDSKDGNEEGSNDDARAEGHAGNEAKEGYDDAKEEVNHDKKGEEVSAAANEEDKHGANKEDDDHNINRNLRILLEEHIQLPVLDVDRGCSVIMDLMDKLTHIFRQGLSNSFYPVPQQAIGVGSTFEGWSHHAQDIVYHVLVPLSPPPGHAFHLELDTTAMKLQRIFRVRVALMCTCTREQLGEDMLCFLHHPEEELRRRQDPSLLHTLCTGTYLDVEKTVHWFYRFIRVAWLLLPQSRHWCLMLQPSSRSCKFQLSKDSESFMAEIIFGVQQGDSGFSSYALKTVVMHLLNTVPLTQWRRGDFQQPLMDILKYLHCSLETKQLHHFVIGNERFPMDISFPSGFRLAKLPNLFQHLASNPDAHRKAMQEYVCLLHRLKQLLIHSS